MHSKNRDASPVAVYTNVAAEYEALASGVGVVNRSDRVLLEVTGADRAAWLHNLTTNEIKKLSPGEGNYAFALNVQGRILFDLVVTTRADAIWIDLDGCFAEQALAHFAKYTIMEDVTVSNRSDEFSRFALVGERVGEVLAALGAQHVANMPWYASTEIHIADWSVDVVRNDFCGPFAVELFVPVAQGEALWNWLTDASGPVAANPVGAEAVNLRRIEAGVPRSLHEITDEYLPAETGQFDRAVSFHKGCYLGQEIVERMRSRDVLARRMVGLRFESGQLPPVGTPLGDSLGVTVGSITSTCLSPMLQAGIGLGYVKTKNAAAGTILQVGTDNGQSPATVVDLPFTCPTDR